MNFLWLPTAHSFPGAIHSLFIFGRLNGAKNYVFLCDPTASAAAATGVFLNFENFLSRLLLLIHLKNH